MLKTIDLQYNYDENNQLSFPDIECKKGEHWLLLGQSGCGKTTLLHLLGGMLTPQNGSVKVGDTNLNTLTSYNPLRSKGGKLGIGGTVIRFFRIILNGVFSFRSSKLDNFRGKNIGIIFQKPHFLKSLTVGENLVLAQQLAGEKADKTRIEDLLARLNLGHKFHSKTSSLSQGEQQRVAIARALVNRPQVILADEPTSALDDKNTEEVIQLLEESAREVEATLLVVTHDARLKARFSNQIELSSDGES